MVINDNTAERWVGLYREGIIELMICPPKPGLILVLSIWEHRTPTPNACVKASNQGLILIPSHSPLPVPHHSPWIVLLSIFQNFAPLSIFTAIVSTSTVVSCLYHCSTGSTPNPGAPAVHSTQCSHGGLLKGKPDHATLTLTSIHLHFHTATPFPTLKISMSLCS